MGRGVRVEREGMVEGGMVFSFRATGYQVVK